MAHQTPERAVPPLPTTNISARKKRPRFRIIVWGCVFLFSMMGLAWFFLASSTSVPSEISVTDFVAMINDGTFAAIDIHDDGAIEGLKKPVIGVSVPSGKDDKVFARFPPASVSGKGFNTLLDIARQHDVRVNYKSEGMFSSFWDKLRSIFK